MLANSNVDRKWSNKVEGDDGVRTLECLRGRLLAEREASRLAREQAEVMEKKLMELEEQLKMEIKHRNRAEKKLKFIQKKLETLNISTVSDDSEQSRSSQNSCSSSTGSFGPKESEKDETKSQTTISESSTLVPDNLKENDSDFTLSSTCNGSCHAFSGAFKSGRSSEDLKTADQSNYSSRCSDWDSEEGVDNSLALVPIGLPQETYKTTELKMVSRNVSDVLAAIRHAREMLQNSIERRHIIHVG